MLLIVSLFFLAIILGLAAVYVGYVAAKTSPTAELHRRLRALAVSSDERIPSDLSVSILREMTPLDRMLYKLALTKKLDRLIQNSGLKLDIKMFMLYTAAAAAAGFVLGALAGRGVIFALILMVVCGAAPTAYLTAQKNRRIAKFTDEFPSALDMIARSLRAGHAVSTSIQMVGSEMSEPIAGLFKTAHEEQILGLSMKDALNNMSERMDSMDLRLFLSAVNLHRDVGGNLAETLERLAGTIRERIKIRRQIRVYTAQGRLSGYILAALPIAMAMFLFLTSPDYLAELTKVEEGKYAIAAVVAGQIVGFMVIRKLINIKI